MVYEDLSIDFGRRNKHPKSRYGVQTRLRALLEPAISKFLAQDNDFSIFSTRQDRYASMRELSNHAVLSMSGSTMAVSSKYTQDLSVQIVSYSFLLNGFSVSTSGL